MAISEHALAALDAKRPVPRTITDRRLQQTLPVSVHWQTLPSRIPRSARGCAASLVAQADIRLSRNLRRSRFQSAALVPSVPETSNQPHSLPTWPHLPARRGRISQNSFPHKRCARISTHSRPQQRPTASQSQPSPPSARPQLRGLLRSVTTPRRGVSISPRRSSTLPSQAVLGFRRLGLEHSTYSEDVLGAVFAASMQRRRTVCSCT